MYVCIYIMDYRLIHIPTFIVSKSIMILMDLKLNAPNFFTRRFVIHCDLHDSRKLTTNTLKTRKKKKFVSKSAQFRL